MAWDGYFQIVDPEGVGIEVINGSRTEAYVSQAQRYWMRENYNYDNAALPWLLGNYPLDRWRTPLLDNAPWVDHGRTESYDFWGIYPLSVDGLENSTREATPFESILNGGVPGRLRHASRSIVFNCVLVAGDDLAADYGMAWFKKVLLGSGCTPQNESLSGLGGGLRYFSAEPVADMEVSGSGSNPGDCLDPLYRELRRFTVTSGPTVVSKRTATDGSSIWSIQFTGVAGDPFEYSKAQEIVRNFGGAGVTNPYVTGVTGGTYDNVGAFYVDEVCPSPIYEPVYNPACPAPIAPPTVPSVEVLCGPDMPDFWVRRSFTIPVAYIPSWTDVVPQISIAAVTEDLGAFRVRFFSDPDGSGLIDNCSPLGDVVVSYLQEGWTLVVDAMRENIYVRDGGGGNRRADALVFDSFGDPMDWFALSCGEQILVTVDSIYLDAYPTVSLNLVGRGN